MREWEYLMESDSHDHPIDDEVMDKLGREGWELVAVLPRKYMHTLIFKRPIPAPMDRLAGDPLY